MNLPNILTLLRILIVFIFIGVLPQEGLSFKLTGLFLFLLAAITDFLDGYYARKYQLMTGFGKIMDPIADKFLVLASFFLFARMGLIPLWMVMIIAFRELLLTGMRLIAVRHGRVLAAEGLGKAKTVLQMSGIISFLVFLVFVEMAVRGDCPESYALRVYLWSYTWMFFVVAMTILSGVSFLWNNRRNFFYVR